MHDQTGDEFPHDVIHGHLPFEHIPPRDELPPLPRLGEMPEEHRLRTDETRFREVSRDIDRRIPTQNDEGSAVIRHGQGSRAFVSGEEMKKNPTKYQE